MRHFGIVSYNIYCNFTNYGSALQSWALFQTVEQLGGDMFGAKLIDYCPEVLADKDPLDPFRNMWDKDEESRRMCELSLPAIKENYYKFDRFYNTAFKKTKNKYTSKNFNDVVFDEQIDGFICGSDTIFCIDEFKGFDDGYYANYDCMKHGYSISYAASFGDAHFNADTYKILNERLSNFKAIGLRENDLIPYVTEHTSVDVQRTIDPTLLLTAENYDSIAEKERLESRKYLLLYARRYNKKMEEYAQRLADKNGWVIVEISLRATNADKHRMFYEAGVEEFLSLVKYAEYVVTNSFHGMIFSVQYKRQFVIFSREQCSTKITELLELFELSDRLMITGSETIASEIDYDAVHSRIAKERKRSLEFLREKLFDNPAIDAEILK